MRSFSVFARCSVRIVARVCGLALVLSGLAGAAYAGFPASIPEIDPASAAAAIALAIGGTALLRHRRK